MNVLDPGHRYEVASFDGGDPQSIVFVKREGQGYPFNVGHHPGTNCQEVLRILIDRVGYLQRQIPCAENELIIDHLRASLRLFEERAAFRHGRVLGAGAAEIETEPFCATCGHIGCMSLHIHERRDGAVAQRESPTP